MPDNFYDTAMRMHKSAQHLHQAEQYHNACYTAGYVVECYLKVIRKCCTGFSGNTHDLLRLWNETNLYLTTSSASPINADHQLDVTRKCPEIMAIWDPVSTRYRAALDEFDKPTSVRMITEIREVLPKLNKLNEDGLT